MKIELMNTSNIGICCNHALSTFMFIFFFKVLRPVPLELPLTLFFPSNFIPISLFLEYTCVRLSESNYLLAPP